MTLRIYLRKRPRRSNHHYYHHHSNYDDRDHHVRIMIANATIAVVTVVVQAVVVAVIMIMTPYHHKNNYYGMIKGIHAFQPPIVTLIVQRHRQRQASNRRNRIQNYSRSRIRNYSRSKKKYSSIDIEDRIDDPEFLDTKNNPKYKKYKLDANYDNDFDTSAFKGNNMIDGGAQYSCVVNYDTLYNGDITAIPFISRYDSDSTWITYGTNDNDVVQPAGTYGQLKEELSNLLKDPRVEVTVAISVLLSCLLVAISSTFENFIYRNILLYIEDGITVIFALDFFGRWMSSNKDFGRHVLNLQFAIDVVVVVIPLLFTIVLPDNVDTSSLWIPEYMTSPSALINLELLRVLRLRRVFQDMTTYTKFERALGIRNSGVQVWQLQLARVLFSLFTLLSVSTGLIYTAEHDVNPMIPNYFTALYFCISTLATLGLGDITPITWQGQLVVCGTIVAGVAIVPAQAAALVEALVSRKDIPTKNQPQQRSQQQPRTTTTTSTDNDTDALLTTNILNGSLSSSSSSVPAISNSNNNGGRLVFEIETTIPCPNCHATMHWSTAQYCWSCGASLHPHQQSESSESSTR